MSRLLSQAGELRTASYTSLMSAFRRGVKHVYAEVEDGPDRFYARCGFRKEYEWHSMRLSKA